MLSVIETRDGFDNFRLGTDYAEPYIATNPTNPLNSICAFVFNRVYYTINGFDWRSVNAAPGTSADPFICFDDTGKAYYLYYYANSLWIARSSNGGSIWSSYLVYPGYADKSSIIAVQTGGPFANYLYTVWQARLNDTVNVISFCKSTNAGVNWTNPLRVNILDSTYCPWIAVGPNNSINGGSLYCAYNSYTGLSDTIIINVRRSTDAGNTFMSEKQAARLLHPTSRLKDTVGVNACIQMAADNSNGPHRGNVYIVYTMRPSLTDDADVYFTRSTDYGTNWSLPKRVNDDATTTDQWMPSLAVDNNTGKLFISWYDSRIDPANNIQTKLFGTVSSDGGNTFSSNTPISTVSFDPRKIVQYFGSPGYMGHYNGISAIGNTSYASWVDGRTNNTMGSYTAYYPDFSMLLDTSTMHLSGNDSGEVDVKIPALNGPFSDRIIFSAALDSQPSVGSITFNFTRDSINNIPDSSIIKVKTSGVINSSSRKIFIKASASANQVPVHMRVLNVFVNMIGIINLNTEIPQQFKLFQNYPNPFNPGTHIKFSLPKEAFVRITIYDVLGRQVQLLAEQNLNAGTYSVDWDAGKYPSGIYYYSIESNGYYEAKKMILLK